jgi:four helix bundle protein
LQTEIRSYKDLNVWQAAMDLTVACYKATSGFPADERFGLTSHIRRASSSVAANIAEGHGRESSGAFVQGLRIAQGSIKELETHLILCGRINLLDEVRVGELLARCDEIGRMLRALIRKLQDTK